MSLEINELESEYGNNNFQYITPDSMEKLVLPELLPIYEGEGETSFLEKYDQDKLEYLRHLGIEIPEEWIKDRAMLVTTFIATGTLLVLENIRRDDPENFKLVLLEKNKQLKEARVDDYGYRIRLANGSLVEEYHKKLGFSANPQKKVSNEELKLVIQYLMRELSSEE